MQGCSPGEGGRKEFSRCFSPCPGSRVRHSTNVLLPAFCGQKMDPSHLKLRRAQKTHLGKLQHCSPEKVPGTNSLAASHPALAAMSGTAQKFCSLLSVVSKINPSALQSLRAQKSHFGKVQHSSHKEGTRKKFSCCSHPALEAM